MKLIELNYEDIPKWTVFGGIKDDDAVFPFVNDRDFSGDYVHYCKPNGFLATTIVKGPDVHTMICVGCKIMVPSKLRKRVKEYLAFMNAAARLK